MLRYLSLTIDLLLCTNEAVRTTLRADFGKPATEKQAVRVSCQQTGFRSRLEMNPVALLQMSSAVTLVDFADKPDIKTLVRGNRKSLESHRLNLQTQQENFITHGTSQLEKDHNYRLACAHRSRGNGNHIHDRMAANHWREEARPHRSKI